MDLPDCTVKVDAVCSGKEQREMWSIDIRRALYNQRKGRCASRYHVIICEVPRWRVFTLVKDIVSPHVIARTLKMLCWAPIVNRFAFSGGLTVEVPYGALRLGFGGACLASRASLTL